MKSAQEVEYDERQRKFQAEEKADSERRDMEAEREVAVRVAREALEAKEAAGRRANDEMMEVTSKLKISSINSNVTYHQ